MAEFVAAGTIAVDPTGNSPTLTVEAPGARRGDLILVYSWALDLLGWTVSGPEAPTLAETIYSDVSSGGSNIIFAGFVTSASQTSVPLVRGGGQRPGPWVALAWVLRGVDPDAGWLEEFDFVAPVAVGTSLTFPSQTPAGAGRMAFNLTMGFSQGSIGAASVSAENTEDAFALTSSQRSPYVGGSVFGDSITGFPSAATGGSTITVEGDESVTYVAGAALMLKPAVPSPRGPSTPSPSRLRLICAKSYNTWITDATYANTLKRVEWSGLSWERVLDDISAGAATLPDVPTNVRCLSDLGGLATWENGLLIERNDEQVWTGPITSLRRVASGLRVGASDIAARFTKLPAIWGSPEEYTSVDSATLFADIINTHSFSPANPWRLTAPEFNVDAPITRELRVEQDELAWAVLSELLGASVDAYVVGGTIYCWDIDRGWVYWNGRRTVVLDGPYNQNQDFVYGQFTNESFTQTPQWGMSGADQTNYFVAPAADVGEQGFRERYISEDVPSQSRAGILYSRDPSPLHLPTEINSAERDAVFQRRADGYIALHRSPPAVIDGVPLVAGAPIDIDHLRPGSIWLTDIHDFGFRQGLQATRLKRVTVTAAKSADGGITEEVVPTLYPLGYESGGDA